jgi:CheY-like chemotaxis protein/Tfp pilus assembly protein PilZ
MFRALSRFHETFKTSKQVVFVQNGEAVDRLRSVREPRLVTRCRVEFERMDRRVIAESEDLSRNGVFVRTEELLPVGAVTEVTLTLPDGARFRVIARVAHLLSPSAARALGRHVGMGFQFLETDSIGRDALVTYLEDLLDELTPPPQPLPAGVRVVLAEPSPPLLERIAIALGQAGFHVDAFEDGADAYAACAHIPPDVVVAAAEMPGMDGWTLFRTMAMHPRLDRVPVVFVSDDQSDMTRLQAYRLGVRDYITRPFIEEELVIRLARIVGRDPRASVESTMLSGSLSEISIPTLLSLLDFERKSGILVLLGPRRLAARLFVAEGRIVKVEAGDPDATPRERLMDVLDWTAGTFEFTSCEVIGSDEVGVGTSALLLEHARIRDEARESSRNDRE